MFDLDPETACNLSWGKLFESHVKALQDIAELTSRIKDLEEELKNLKNTPNKESLAALKEAEEGKGTKYHSVDEFINAIEKESDEPIVKRIRIDVLDPCLTARWDYFWLPYNDYALNCLKKSNHYKEFLAGDSIRLSEKEIKKLLEPSLSSDCFTAVTIEGPIR